MDTRASTSLVIAFTIGSLVAVEGAGWQTAASGEPAPAVSAVLPSIEILPMPVVFFSVYKGETADRSITVVNHEARPLQIIRVEPGGTHFEATLIPVDPGKVFRLDVRVPRNVAPGRYMEAVYLHTNHPTMSRLAIGVNVLVKNDLYVNPEVVDLGRMSIKELTEEPALLQMLTQSLIVKKRAGEFSIRTISFDLESLSITRSPAGRGQAFRVDVSLVHEKLKPGPIKGTIRILTDDKEFPELIIPVRGEVY